jgi:Histidine kinase-, DNA gyrase B-, and HSP90-like ATPase
VATSTQPPTRDKSKQSSSGLRRPRPSLVHPANFVLATRDTGYKTTALAIAELVDNSLQANATEVHVEVVAHEGSGTNPIKINVSDNGSGMDPRTLAGALTFGGSTRFDDRSSLGRYGMGLPNGALSRARCVEVYSWRGKQVWMSRLDVDDIVKSRHRTLPPIQEVEHPPFPRSSKTGTVVRLSRCDRLEYKRVSTIKRHLAEDLGRIYRHFVGGILTLTLNGTPVEPNDPLMLDDPGLAAGARQFGDVLNYQLAAAEGVGRIEVRFSELPIERWHSLSSAEKRQLRITGAPSVSVLRAGREIDRGWFFMGTKRRENYDDWWRCEIRFEPVLDELFGITHAKQAIAPAQEVLELLLNDLEPIARALNSRVRRRFELLKVSTPLGNAERRAARAEEALPPLPARPGPAPPDLEQALAGFELTRSGDCPYQLVVTELPTTAAFETFVKQGRLVVALNSRHPLYRDLYGPLAVSDERADQEVATHVALTVLAAARAEWLTPRATDRNARHEFRRAWSNVLASFFNTPA